MNLDDLNKLVAEAQQPRWQRVVAGRRLYNVLQKITFGATDFAGVPETIPLMGLDVFLDDDLHPDTGRVTMTTGQERGLFYRCGTLYLVDLDNPRMKPVWQMVQGEDPNWENYYL